jgi:general secretion pathway protein D
MAICAALCGCSSLPGSIADSAPLIGSGSSAKTLAEQTPARTENDRQYIQRVMELRQRYHGSTDVAELEALHRAESEAAAHYLTAGLALAREEHYEQAIEKFEAGLLAQPANGELQQARQTALGRKEVARLYAEGLRAKSVGNYDLAETLLQRAVAVDGANAALKQELEQELADLDRDKKSEEQQFVLVAFRTPVPVTVNFRDAKLRDALKVLCDPYNLNFVFDKNVDNFDVSVSAKNVTVEQAFNMILRSSNTAYKIIGPNSVFIYEDTAEKRKLYADRYFKTFHLSTLKADRMAELLKASMDIKSVANNDLGTIQVRDTRETLDVVEKLIATNDRKPAEIMLNMEVLEIDRNKADSLGIDLGSQITAQVPQVTLGTLFGGHGAEVLNQGVVTFPAINLNYLKSNTDARTLSNPRVRTVDGQPAKIHVGDRVPLQSATIQQATGQSSVLYEYHDIGIKLDVLPKYHLDGSIFVDLNIEVSSLGQNIGTPTQPAYTIGTRNVHTTMILREGETAVLGGLISENEQGTLSGLPGLSEGSIVRQIFSTTTTSGARTELILTITPYLVRSQSLPRRGNTDFYSGTEDSYSTRTGFDYLNKPSQPGQPPKYNLSLANSKDPVKPVKQQALLSWQPVSAPK